MSEMHGPSVVIYTDSRFHCPYCEKTKQTLQAWSIGYTERDVADPEIKAELRAKRPTARTVPQIFLANDYYIGGCDDLVRLDQQRLETLIELNT